MGVIISCVTQILKAKFELSELAQKLHIEVIRKFVEPTVVVLVVSNREPYVIAATALNGQFEPKGLLGRIKTRSNGKKNGNT